MNPPKFINSISVLAFSVQNLIKSWHRRQKWSKFFFCSSINEEEGHSSASSNDIRAPWGNNLTNFLESTPVHCIAILLLLMDLILTILELSSSLLTRTPQKNHYKMEKNWYHWAGIGILSLLSAKAMALAIGLGSSFIKRPGYVVDATVAIIALFLEAFLERKGGGLLVIVSLWRVVRVVESAFELSDEAIEAQVEGIMYQFQLLREENTRLLETIAEKDIIIDKLEKIIEKLPLQQQPKCNGNQNNQNVIVA